MVALARVTADLAEARGPDVACSIEVPVAWFEAGATLQIQLPRLMTCARCEGGGCDACGRRGAFEQRAAGIASEVAVVLPRQPAATCAPVKLRLPALGARAPRSPAAGGAPLAPAAVPDAPQVELEPSLGEAPAAETREVPAAEAQALEGLEGAQGLAGAEPAGAQDTAAAMLALPAGEGQAVPAAEAEALPAAGEPRELPPGHLLLTVIPRAPDPAWAPPSNVQALVLAPAQRSFWAWLQPLEMLLFPDRLVAALGDFWRARAPAVLRSRPVWIWAALAVVVTVLSVWLLTRSGSRSQ